MNWNWSVGQKLQSRDDPYRRKLGLKYPVTDVQRQELVPAECDFLIIGGGIVGSSIAWWLKQRLRDDEIKVVVFECDDTVCVMMIISRKMRTEK